MTMPAWPTTLPNPSQDSQLQKNYNTLFSQFGGGYVQLGQNGANWQIPTWNLVFNNLSAADSATLETFLDANAATVFTWAPPSGNGSVWYINQSQNSYGFQKTTTGLLNSYSVSLTAVY